MERLLFYHFGNNNALEINFFLLTILSIYKFNAILSDKKYGLI